jgi:hypothetical protein
MRKLIAVAILVVAFPLTALAESCVQSDGQSGVFINGQGSDDDRCLTADEYSVMFSIDSLVEAGVADRVVDNGDGTSVIVSPSADLEADPLDRLVSANPSLEPDAPTVRRVLFSGARFFPV